MWLLSRNVRFFRKQVSINGRKLSALVADSPKKQAVGLMFREKLEQNECMLFIFGRPNRYSIWMRNMRFPIDILWVDEKKRIVDIKEAAPPAKRFEFATYKPRVDAKYVLELKSGFVKKNKITKAAKIRFN